MRVLLINPPLNTALPAAGAYPMGLAYIAAVLRQASCDVDILDIRLNGYDKAFVSEWLQRHKADYDLYGIGGMVTAYSYIQWLSEMIKRMNPSALVIAGGSVCTAGELLLTHSGVDAVCVGEGEKVIRAIVDMHNRNQELSMIPNLIVRKGEKILHTHEEEPLNIDEIPLPAWDLFDMERYTSASYLVPVDTRSITMITGRGCPYTCSFCYRNFGRRVRHRNLESVILEMQTVADRFGIGHIDFLDEIFNVNRNYVSDLCRRMIEERLRLTWRCIGRADLVDRDILHLMYEAGCRWIGYGIESGSPEMLNRMKKRERVEDIERSIQLAREAGIIVTGTFILGFPGETTQTIKETEQFFIRNRIFNVPFFPVPYPGTDLFDESVKKKRIVYDESFIRSLERDATELIVNFTEMSDGELQGIRDKLVLRHSHLIPSMEPSGGLYTVYTDKRVDRAIEEHLHVIVNRLRMFPNVKSIILGGGFGRGEGSVLVDENGVRPVNDYDIFLVVTDEDSTDYRPIGAELARTLNIRWIDILPVKDSSITTLSLSQCHYDLKYGSRHLWGKYVLDQIPAYDDGIVDSNSITTLLLNRLVCALEAYSEEFEQRPLNQQEAFFLTTQTGKVVSACIECLLMKAGRYHPSYRLRRERFERIFPSELSLIRLNNTATQFKLRPSGSLVQDPVAYWKEAMREYVRLLASLLVVDAAPSIPALTEAVMQKKIAANPIERAELLLLLARECQDSDRRRILDAARRELEDLPDVPSREPDWEELRVKTIDLWRRASHGETGHSVRAKGVVLMILIDGLRHDYLNPNDAPFLYALGKQNIEGRVRETFAFELRPAFFAGLHPDECDIANMYCYSPASSPFAEIDLSSGEREVINRQLRDHASQKGYSLIKHVGSSAEIPLQLLKYFDFSEKFHTSDPGSIPGQKTVFDLLRERNKRFLWIGYPDGPGTTMDVRNLFMSRLTEDLDFIYLHFSELDWVGHEFGPHSERQKTVMKEIDDAVRDIFGRLNRTFATVRFIVFGDHGQVAVEQQIDLKSLLERSGLVLEQDYLYFLDSTQARFWFFNDKARELIIDILRGIPGGRILSHDDLKSLHADFKHKRYGDLIFVVDEGVSIFPNFFQSKKPCKGLHGYLPDVEANWAALIVGGCGIQFRTERVVEMVDLYPTLLDLLGLGRSPHPIAGISLFERFGMSIRGSRYRASLVMPTYNRLEILKKSLRAIENQEFPRDEYELIVIDDGSSDGTLEYLEQYGRQTSIHLNVIKQDHSGPGAARNRGILAASGTVVIFVGDDMIMSDDFISNHIYFHDENPHLADACLGFIDWSPDIEINPLMEHVTSKEGAQQFNYGILEKQMPHGIEGNSFWFFWSSNLSVKRAFLLTHGLFNDRVFKHAMWEDIELGYRLQKVGLRLHYRKECVVYHEHQLTLGSFAERQRMVGWYAHDAERLGIAIDAFKQGENQIYSRATLDALVSSLSEIPKRRFPRSAMVKMYNYCLEYAARLGYRERTGPLVTDVDVVTSILFNVLEETAARLPQSGLVRSRASSAAVETFMKGFCALGPTENPGKSDSQAAQAHQCILKLFVIAGKRAEAIFALEKLVESFPDYAPAHNDLGVLYGEEGKLDKAQTAYEKAVSLAPANATFRKNLADFLYVAMKRPEEAARHYERALQINARDIDTLLILGNIEVERRRFDKAMDYFRKALAIDPTNEMARKTVEALQVAVQPVDRHDRDSANSVRRNRLQWSNYDWPEGGDEWSSAWGGTENLWRRTILPRIGAFLPANHILEIAPGFGRCTQYLVTQCRQMTLVDLTEKCIDACRHRFKDHSHIRYFVNDGESLDMIEDDSLDFVFSWDSLVHVEKDVMQAYLRQLSAKLKVGGVCFLHHSNIGTFRDGATGRLTVENRHWRGENMSAELFRTYCREAGLQCLSQEIVAWGGDVLNDCFSILMKGSDFAVLEPLIVENPSFMHEAAGTGEPPGLYRMLDKLVRRPTAPTPDQTHNEAQRLIKEGRFPEAVWVLETCFQFRPDDARTRNDLGHLYFLQGEKNKARVHYKKALELDPSNMIPLENLADFKYAGCGLLEEALELYHEALTRNPNDAKALAALGTIYTSRGRLDVARSFLERILSVNPGNKEAQRILHEIFQAHLNCQKMSQNAMSDLDVLSVSSQLDYRIFRTGTEGTEIERRNVESDIARDADKFTVPGFCFACGESTDFLADYSHAWDDNGKRVLNWRERLECPKCGFNNRTRASLHILQSIVNLKQRGNVYIAEQQTPLYRWLRERYPNVIGSEYLGENIPGGSIIGGIRHEDLTSLSFSDNELDIIIALDVFEHVHDDRKAFQECLRTLVPGGLLFFTVPFDARSETNVTKADVTSNGKIVHLLPPEYHGDPVRGKCLSFRQFGWEIFDDLTDIGFSEVRGHFYWSKAYGYLGENQVVFTAYKPGKHIRAERRSSEQQRLAYGEVGDARTRLDTSPIAKMLAPLNKSVIEEYHVIQQRWIAEDNIPEACDALAELLRHHPMFAPAHNDLGVLSCRQGDKAAALHHYEKAVELEPGNATYLKNLADFYYMEMGRTEDALRLYHRVLADHPDDAETLRALGHVCIALSRLDDARTLFERALAVEPGNEALQTLVARLRVQPDRAEAEDGREGGPSVSIIIPAGDDPKTLSRCIGTVLQNTEDADYEIVLTSGLAPAGGEESFMPAGKKNVRLTAVPVNGNSISALNAATRKASGRYLVFMDARLVLSRGWLGPLLRAAETMPLVGAVSPRVGIPPDTLVEAGYSMMSGSGPKGNGEGEKIDAPRYNFVCETPSGSRFMTLVPRAAWEQSGGFDEELTDFGMALMDLSLSIRAAGKSLIYQPLSAVGFVEPSVPEASDKYPTPADPAWLNRLRPVASCNSGPRGAQRTGTSVLVLGVYLTDRLHTADDIVAVLAASKTCSVTQRWVALGDAPPSSTLLPVTVRTIRERTPKFQIVNGLLSGEDLTHYDYVLLTDDDVVLPEGFLDAFIGLQGRLGFAIAQPARTSNSYIDHPIVEQANGLLARETRFVEIGPVVSFHRSVFDLVFPFDLTSPMGWGYENVWSLRIGRRGLKMGIIDAVPIDHSIRKPVENYDWGTADRQRAEFLNRNAHLPIETCFTTVQAIPLEGEPG